VSATRFDLLQLRVSHDTDHLEQFYLSAGAFSASASLLSSFLHLFLARGHHPSRLHVCSACSVLCAGNTLMSNPNRNLLSENDTLISRCGVAPAFLSPVPV
jgi:hypothetical protein